VVKIKITIPITVHFIGPILWGHSGPLCHALSLSSLLLLWTSILHCHSPGVATVARRLRYSYSWLRFILVVVSTVATPGEWQCKIRTCGVRRLAVANGPNIFQMLLVILARDVISIRLSVPLSVTEVHWRIIANLGFKFRFQFTAHCGRGACGREH